MEKESGFTKVINSYLDKLKEFRLETLAIKHDLELTPDGKQLIVPFFGKEYFFDKEGVKLNNEPADWVETIIIFNYLLSPGGFLKLEPWKDFSEFPGARFYKPAFIRDVEKPLGDLVPQIITNKEMVMNEFMAEITDPIAGANLALIFHPFPKVRIFALLYKEDEEFPASSRVLYSNNADQFLPTECLADMAEHWVRKLKDFLKVK